MNKRLLSLLILVLAILMPIKLWAGMGVNYSILSNDSTIETLYYGLKPNNAAGPSSEYRNKIIKVIIDSSISTISLSPARLFYGYSKLEEIEGFEYLRDATDMNSMFYGCASLKSIDLSKLYTDNVTDMSNMFAWCTALTNLNLSGFNTENVTNMYGMFSHCESLTSLDLSDFNTANVTDMGNMFYHCYSLTSLNLSSFNTANVMEMYDIFDCCSSLTSLDLSNFNTANVWRMRRMFADCSALTTIYAGSDWSTAAVTESTEMFLGCSNLVGGKGTIYDADHTDYTYAHIDGGTLNPGYFTAKNATSTDKGITIYVNASEAPYLYSWYEDGTTTQQPNGEWPGMRLTEKQTVNGTEYWYYTFSSDISSINIIFNDGVVPGGNQTADITNITSDSFFNYDGASYYENSTTQESTTIYVQASVAPYLYAFDAEGKELNGSFPGEMMTEVVNVNGTEFFAKTIRRTTPFNINILDADQYRTREIYVMSDRYFVYEGKNVYTDVTKQYFDAPDIEISSIAMTGGHNEWDKTALMTEVEQGRKYTTEVDLTDVTLDENQLQFKFFVNACSWLGFTSLTLDAPSYVYNIGDPALFTDSRNFVLDLSQTVARKFNFEATWSGDYQMEEGWTLKITEMNDMPEAYAVLSDSNTMLTFYYDEQKAIRSGMDIKPFTRSIVDLGGGADFEVDSEWYAQRKNIKSVVFDQSFANCTSITSTAYWFDECSNLESISGIEVLNTENVTTMDMMFCGCSSLTTLDVSHFNTANVTDMRSMFNDCSSLKSLDASNFNTQNVTEMRWMFESCYNLTTVYVGSGWTTEAVIYGTDMFLGCTSLVGGAGTVYDSSHTDYTYAHIDGGTSNPGYFTDIESVRRWDFTKWSSGTIANLKADAAASKTTGWSDVEKRADAEVGSEPVEAAKDNCFWLDAETTEANGVAIAELEGLVFNKSYCSSRKLAIAVNYPSTSLGDYAGGAYLWLGDKGHDCFTIPNVKNGQTITIELESHKTSEGRGITLIAGSTELDSFTPTTKASYSWTIPEDCDVVVRNTNGCHIYTITVSGEGTPTDDLEIFSIDKNTTYVSNQPITPTPSVTMTPGNDTEWMTDLAIGLTNTQTGESDDLLSFTASVYYPNSTETFTFKDAVRGTNNPKDANGKAYDYKMKNVPQNGAYMVFETSQDGSLIIPIRVTANKSLFVTESDGTLKEDIQFKDADGNTLRMLTSPLCALSETDYIMGYVSFNAKAGAKYYVFCNGSKPRYAGYVFSKEAIDIDPATMANVKDILETESYAVLTTDSTVVLSSDSTGVTYGKTLTFYYDDQKAARDGMSVGPFRNASDVPWYDQRAEITNVLFNDSFANCNSLTSTAWWFRGCKQLTSITGISNLNTANVIDMMCMFDGCSGLTTLDVSHFNTDNVTDMTSMFFGCSGLTTLDVSHFNTDNVIRMVNMFYGCSGLTTLDVSHFNTDNITSMMDMFCNCSGLTSLNLSSFNTANVTNMSYMFEGCSSLTSLDVSHFNTENVTNTFMMFSGCSELTSLDVSGFNTAKVTMMAAMFNGCSGLKTIYAGSAWTTNALADGGGGDMFLNCISLVGGKGTVYDAEHIDAVYAHIDGGTSNPGYFTDKNAPVIDATFDSNGVLAVGGSTTMSDALEHVGGRDEVAKTITAIVWNSAAALTNSDLTGISNPNMLIYVPSESQAPQNRDNVVIGNDSTGYSAKNIVLADVVEGNGNFYCPKEFTAEMISYTHEYQQSTEVGVSRGWETIAMPFNVQTVMHEKQGLIAPFGNSTSRKHFWLRHISTAGQTHSLAQATTIEANMPYLISMPNSDAYPDEYNLAGRVTFSSQNVPVVVTDIFPVHMSSGNGGMLMFVPCFQTQQVHEMVYALNVGEARDGYPEGSVFEANYREIRPFEAFTVHEGNSPAPQFIPIIDFNGSMTGIGASLVNSEEVDSEKWYDLNGRKLQKKPTRKGVYLLNGRKVVIR